MLKTLSIKNFVVVEKLELKFTGGGFVALTGETGAGKSILVGALSLLLGERVDSKVVRDGSERAEITAEFLIHDLKKVREVLESNGLFELGRCTIKRIFEQTGRSKAWINGNPATLGQLREIGMHLVNIHGQHDHQLLTRASEQRQFLDNYAKTTALLEKVTESWNEWQCAEEAKRLSEEQIEANAAKVDFLKWQLQELEVVDYSKESWPALESEYKRMANVATLSESMSASSAILYGNDNSIDDRIALLKKAINSVIEYDPQLKEILDLVEAAEIHIKESILMAKAYSQKLDFEPHKSSKLESKVDKAYVLAKKHKVEPQNLPQLRQNMEQEIRSLNQKLDSRSLDQAANEAKKQYEELAGELSERRYVAASALEERVTEAFGLLAMRDKMFKVTLTPITGGATFGQEKVEFCLSSKSVAGPQPISRVASGGELSRISLAIQSVMVDVVKVPTMVFDEVDAGIGGAVAEIVGRLLSDLGNKHQVMCVTHLAQVAASAKTQWRVVKNNDGAIVSSSAELLDGPSRIKEIARMIGGLKITETSLQHAAEMLDSSSRQF